MGGRRPGGGQESERARGGGRPPGGGPPGPRHPASARPRRVAGGCRLLPVVRERSSTAMRTRLRLGAAAAVGLGALLLATVLASPALAWHSNVTVSARCFQG